MRGGNRKFRNDAVQHIYQISADEGVIFYDDIDRLAFFTISSVTARKYSVQVLAMDIMFTHFHESAKCCRKKQMVKYMQDSTSLFARLYNAAHGRKGALFRHSFGSTPKRSEKDIRTNLAYVDNNAVEKRLCARAEEDRWSFLAYCGNDHPFSEKIDRHRMSKHLRHALKTVDEKFENGRYLGFNLLRTLYKHLNTKEKEQLTDYIITKYMFIDFEEAISYFGSYEKMLTAFNSNTGSEHSLKERYEGKTDVPYRQMLQVCEENGFNSPGRTVFRYSEEQRLELMRLFLRKTDADRYKIGKFLHIQLE